MSFNESVLICDETDHVLNKILTNNGLKVTYEPEITHDQIKEKIDQFNIIIVRSRTKLTKELIERADNCKIIARVGVGLDNIDLTAAKIKNIRVINAVEGAMNAVAELVIGLMLCLARKISTMDRGIRNDEWLKKQAKGTELSGKYLGIIGLGNIGRRLGYLARSLNMNIIGYDVVPIDEQFSKEVGLMKSDLLTLLESSDYVSIHVPLLSSTYHLIDEEKLAVMKPTAKIINTSRGGVIDENALYTALKNGKIGGAALDVFEKEPAISNKLAEFDNVVLTPHMGAQTSEAQSLSANVIGEKIIQVLRGVI